ncbi:MAG TPA: hypothetical protein VMN99_12745 [Anaerolineales bacterium]|nr:hypothetical protein [Anaerolineales bacterium]
MNILSDSFSVLVDHWRLIAGIMLIIFLGQMLVWSMLKMILGDRLTSEEHYSLSVAGWILPISLASGIWLAGGVQRLPAGAFVVLSLITILAFILFLRTRKGPLPGSTTTLFILLVLFGISIFLRLALVSKAVIPLYFDSAQHYLIIKNLLGDSAGSMSWPTTGYYHIGFHLVTAVAASSLRADIINAMLIVGQMILATIPLSVFLIIRHETQSNIAGIFAVFLAAFGWYMPAYAVNWGKYPALTSLTLTTFVLSLAYLSLQYRNVLSSTKYLALNVMLFSAMVVSGFTHSRSLVIIGIVALAWVTATWWQKLPKLWRALFFFAILLGIMLEINLIRTKDVFGPLFDPYWNQGVFITSIILFLSLFAQWAYPRLAFTSILVTFLLLGSLFIPVNVAGHGNLTMLDRPFVEIILYLPLSLLGGLGLAGLEQSLPQLKARLQTLRFLSGMSGRYIGVFLIGMILVNALTQYNLYPSDCCSIVGRDDLVAIDWMDENLPPDARILIASTELRVLASDSSQGSVSGDAGAWINPLTERATIFLPYQSDFSQQTTLDALCQMEVDYIYVGETGVTFNVAQITPYPNWYRILLSMPKVQVYQVIGCPELPSSNQSSPTVKTKHEIL